MMKTKRNLLAILVLMFTIGATAVEKPKINVQSLNKNQILLTVENPLAMHMETTIENANGDVVYYKQSKKPVSSSNKIFDLKNLENGNYSLKLCMNGRVVERDLTIASHKIMVGKEKEALAPYFSYCDESLVISQLNFDKKSYAVEIYDRQGLIFKKSIGNQSPLNSAFDLAKLEAGNYTVFLNSGSKYYSYEFVKE